MSELHVVLGAGPIGRATAAALSAEGAEVRVITRSGTRVAGAEAVACDVRDARALGPHLVGAHAVHHAAAPAYHRWAEEFPALQASIVEAARGRVPRLVVVENLYGYGPHLGELTESHALAATTKKGRVRARLSESLLELDAKGALRVALIRGSDFFGPGVEQSGVGARFFRGVIERGVGDAFGRDDMQHTFTYAPDFGRAMAIAGRDDRALGRAWHVPSAPALTLGELAQRIARAAGRPSARVRTMPRWAMSMLGVFVPALRESIEMLYEWEAPYVVSSRAFTERFGMQATPLDTAIDDTVASLRAPLRAAA